MCAIVDGIASGRFADEWDAERAKVQVEGAIR
jgi:hypothetical protein